MTKALAVLAMLAASAARHPQPPLTTLPSVSLPAGWWLPLPTEHTKIISVATWLDAALLLFNPEPSGGRKTSLSFLVGAGDGCLVPAGGPFDVGPSADGIAQLLVAYPNSEEPRAIVLAGNLSGYQSNLVVPPLHQVPNPGVCRLALLR